ncbi:MAG: lipid A deacylase LpxR family protein [Bacteroidota bacterium]
MRKHLLIYGASLLVSIAARAQSGTERFAREFSFTTENDAYLFHQNDAYYTNGFLFSLKTAKERKGKKIIKAWELGQMIYTPLIRKTSGPADIDRPYCGYLFLKFSEAKFTGKNSVLQFNGGLGQVGDASFGESVQNSYHKLLGYGRFTGWQYQVQNALGVDLGLSYAHTLFEDSSWIKLMPVVEANLGMVFTNAKLGSYLCIGSFENNANSALWNARVQAADATTRKNHEIFFYWHPEVIFQGYNATVQGGMFSKGSGTAVLKDPTPVMFQQSWGICFAQGRWTTQFALVFQTREAESQKDPQRYGSAQVSYRFR